MMCGCEIVKNGNTQCDPTTARNCKSDSDRKSPTDIIHTSRIGTGTHVKKHKAAVGWSLCVGVIVRWRWQMIMAEWRERTSGPEPNCTVNPGQE